MSFIPFELQKPLEIRKLYSVHYFEYTSDYAFSGETHDFWEFLYVDKGTIHVQRDGENLDLTRGEMIFHAPGEFHALSANGVVAPNLIVVSFACGSPAMEFFRRANPPDVGVILHQGGFCYCPVSPVPRLPSEKTIPAAYKTPDSK